MTSESESESERRRIGECDIYTGVLGDSDSSSSSLTLTGFPIDTAEIPGRTSGRDTEWRGVREKNLPLLLFLFQQRQSLEMEQTQKGNQQRKRKEQLLAKE